MKIINLLNPKKVIHTIGLEGRTARDVLKYGYPDILLQFLGGLGDELMLTCIAHELKKRSPNIKLWQVSAAATLFDGNSDYAHVFDRSRWELRHSNLLNKARMYFSYSEKLDGDDVWKIPDQHIIVKMLKQAGISGEVEIRPYVYLTNKEISNGKLWDEQVCIQSVGMGTHETWMQNKMWFHERWVSVIRQIKLNNPSLKFIQLGDINDPSLGCDTDLRGKTTLRESAALLASSKLFIGTQGFLVHLARAVDTRSVVVIGGREHSWQTGYTGNINIEQFPECSPCWAMSRCDYDHKCMSDISVQNTVEAVQKGLNLFHIPMSQQTINLFTN